MSHQIVKFFIFKLQTYNVTAVWLSPFKCPFPIISEYMIRKTLKARAVDYHPALKRSTHPVETLVGGGHMYEYDVTNLLHPLSGFSIDF
jgi:hypothetical protein